MQTVTLYRKLWKNLADYFDNEFFGEKDQELVAKIRTRLDADAEPMQNKIDIHFEDIAQFEKVCRVQKYDPILKTVN